MSVNSYTYKGNRRGDDTTSVLTVPGTKKETSVGGTIDLTEEQYGSLNVFFELEPAGSSDDGASDDKDPAKTGQSEQGSAPAVKTGPTTGSAAKMDSDASSGTSR